MIPLRDDIPHRRKPIVTVVILAINICVYLYELFLGMELDNFVFRYGFIPYKLIMPLSVHAKLIPLFTSMFMHAGFLHLLGNSLYLWIFADNVEDRLGHFNFLIFYLLCGISASLIHALFNWGSKVPAVGASGAIAGILGAYFLMFPKARVLTLVPLFLFWEIVEIPAFFFLGFWFLYQFLLGLVSLGRMGAGIAFWAHIGGFLSGVVFLRFFLKRRTYW
ncbi:MAG: rhomboid family intramembrane serine protease [Candidatus Omnitrophota bacterium]|nr:rhomboid family intramembrane serine protease [Candidatus Omnitrophota bacterium]RKY33223.1 MAG: rhomboid family intramembrane serine protease [Candidatus Omnitrophota bacterium]HDN85700.1 rhomboid family intramembrane serine protease [Candidatus Omnitrophota bacterium]